MPQLPPSDGTIRIVPHFNYNGNHCVNVLHYRATGPYDGTDMAWFGAEWRAAWNAHLKPLCPQSLTLTHVEVADLSSLPIATQIQQGGSQYVGTNTSPALPSHVTAVASLRTGFRGRSVRGRIYHVGLAEGQVEGDQLNEATAAALQTAYNNMILLNPAGSALDAQQIVLSYYSNNAIRAIPHTQPILSVSVDPFVDSQRRRLSGRGR